MIDDDDVSDYEESDDNYEDDDIGRNESDDSDDWD